MVATDRRVPWRAFFLVLLSAYACVVIFSPSPPVLQDYPDWIYQAALFGRVVVGQATPHYELRHYPVPNSLTTVGAGLLSAIFGWQLAARVWLVLVLGLLGAATLRFLEVLGTTELAMLPVLANATIVGLDLWNGSINFQFGLALLLFFLAHLLRPARSTTVTAMLLLLCFFTHMLACATALLALAALTIQTRTWRPLLATVPTLACLCWYAARREPTAPTSALHLLPAILAVAATLFWFGGRRAHNADGQGLAPTAALFLPFPMTTGQVVLASKILTFWGAFGLLNVLTSGTGPDRTLWPTLPFCLLSLGGVLSSFLVLALLLKRWKSTLRCESPHDFLLVSSLCLFLLFLFLPADALGVTGIDSRFLHLALLIGLCTLHKGGGWAARSLAALSVLFCLVNLYQFRSVQFVPHTISVAAEPLPLPGSSAVAPAIRLDFYNDLQHERLHRWIFPTAIFRYDAP